MAGGDTTPSESGVGGYEWEVVDENWSRCRRTGLWLFISGKWLYEYDQKTQSLTPLKAYVTDACKLPDSASAGLKVKCATSTMQGRRPAQEDRAVIHADLGAYTIPNQTKNNFALQRSLKSKYEQSCPRLCTLVCDGHAGSQAADYVLETLPLKIATVLNTCENNLDVLLHERSSAQKKKKSNIFKRQPIREPINQNPNSNQDTTPNTEDIESSSNELASKKVRLNTTQPESTPIAPISNPQSAAGPPVEPPPTDPEAEPANQPAAELPDEPVSELASNSQVEPPIGTQADPAREAHAICASPSSRESDAVPSEEISGIEEDLSPQLQSVIEEVKGSLKCAFETVDREFLKVFRTARDGCTATIACVLGRHLFVAGCGDTRAVLASVSTEDKTELSGHEWTATRVTVDHKPGNPDEKVRIESRGGLVKIAGLCARVMPGNFKSVLSDHRRASVNGEGSRGRAPIALAVSRAFGDRALKLNDVVTVTPAVTVTELHPSVHRALIIASDGVWDVLSDDQTVQLVSDFYPEDVQGAASTIVKKAYQLKSSDNITCVVAFFE